MSAPRGGPSAEKDARLPNGLTPAQDVAFDNLARAIASHVNGDPECACDLHPRVPPPGDTAPKRVRPCACKPGEPLPDCAGGDPRTWLCHRPLPPANGRDA